MTANEARLLTLAILDAHGEDIVATAALIKALRSRVGAVNWQTTLETQAATHTPFLTAKLSIPKWLSEVQRLSQ